MSTPNPYPATAPAKKTNWWLIGCGGCLGVIVLGILAFAGIFYGVVKVIKSNESYQTAVTAATNSPEVQAKLGTPIEPGFMPQGNVKANTSNGVTTQTVDITIPLKGPKGSGSVHYSATNDGSKWEVSDFTFTADGSAEKIPLGQ